MRGHKVLIAVLFCVFVTRSWPLIAADGQQPKGDLTDAMKNSVVCLKTSFYGYEPIQPWKNKALSQNEAYACAVGEYQVLTTAWNVADLAFVKALRFGQNEFVA